MELGSHIQRQHSPLGPMPPLCFCPVLQVPPAKRVCGCVCVCLAPWCLLAVLFSYSLYLSKVSR